MPDFQLSSDQVKLRSRAHAFARDVIRPLSRQHDLSGQWPGTVVQAAWQEGFIQTAVPKELGGGGYSAFEEGLLSEELAWGCAGMYTTLTANSLAITPILLAGSEEQKRQWLSCLVERPALAAFALTESGAGSDVGAIACTAKRHGDVFLLNGAKCYITSGDHADFFIVFARTGEATGTRGLSAFLVARETPGLIIGNPMDKMGHRASSQVEVRFENAEVPAHHLLGAEGKGFSIAMATLDMTRASVAAGAVGLARASFELALEHATSRVQFGKPVMANQGVSFPLADVATRIEASRLLAWQAAWMSDEGQRSSMHSAMAKTFATDTAMEAASTAVQVLGGRGYSRDSLAEKFFRDAKLMQIYEGTNEIQRLIISRELRVEERP